VAADGWHVLGAGAMGCLFAAGLAGGGGRVTLLLRPGDRGGPLSIERDGETIELALHCADAASCGPVRRLLVTTKAYDVRAAVAGIGAQLAPDAVIVLLVNGMGLVEELAAANVHADFYCGTTTEGAFRTGPLRICHAGRGETRIGQAGRALAPAWFDAWQRGVDNCQWEQDIDTALWSKLAVNCVINPLTAVHRCRNGALASRKTLRAEVSRLCAEVSQVSYAAGYTEVAQTIDATVAQVIAGTADNRSSMLQDVEAGRRTEIDYITGHLLRVAHAHGIPALHNAALMEEVKHLDD